MCYQAVRAGDVANLPPNVKSLDRTPNIMGVPKEFGKPIKPL